MAKESTIQHYTSSITGNTPSAVDLASGELAINIADEKVFLKNLLGNVVSLSQSKDLSGAFASKATVVTSFNGLTGAVTGVTAGGINTFTRLNTFSAGISSSGITGSLPSIMSDGAGTLTISAKQNSALIPENAVITLMGSDADIPGNSSITLSASQIYLGASQIYLGSGTVNSAKLVYSVNGETGPVVISARSGIAVGNSGKNLTITNSGVTSFNGLTGAVGYSPAFASSSVTGVASFNSTYFAVGATGVVTLASAYQVTGQTVVSGGSSQLVSTSGNTVTIDNRVASASVTGVASFNSTYLTVSNGAVSLASAYQVTGDTVAVGTGIAVSRSGNTSTVTNIGVQSFNGATGAVTGATLGANTFTQLNTFSAGISASSGVTFGGTVNLQDNTLSRVEFLDYFERFVDLGDFASKGAQIAIDLSTAQVFRTKLTVACTGLSVTNTPDNGNANAVGFSLLFVGDGTARTMTWNIGSTAASWAGGVAPTYTSTLNKIDVYSFLSRDGGSTWLGFVGGQNF